ncbi:Hypothetical protein D9617_50g044360 [Elsinoe fawcettii]|nr:Hypothetical protein D9617_50g044360 [Elsinoe fawcettii]
MFQGNVPGGEFQVPIVPRPKRRESESHKEVEDDGASVRSKHTVSTDTSIEGRLESVPTTFRHSVLPHQALSKTSTSPVLKVPPPTELEKAVSPSVPGLVLLSCLSSLPDPPSPPSSGPQSLLGVLSLSDAVPRPDMTSPSDVALQSDPVVHCDPSTHSIISRPSRRTSTSDPHINPQVLPQVNLRVTTQVHPQIHPQINPQINPQLFPQDPQRVPPHVWQRIPQSDGH